MSTKELRPRDHDEDHDKGTSANAKKLVLKMTTFSEFQFVIDEVHLPPMNPPEIYTSFFCSIAGRCSLHWGGDMKLIFLIDYVVILDYYSRI